MKPVIKFLIPFALIALALYACSVPSGSIHDRPFIQVKS